MDQLEISNMAISLVGGRQLETLTDDTVEAEQCSLHYATARGYCLRSRDWTFATRYWKLEQYVFPPFPDPGLSVPADRGGFSHYFDIPGDVSIIRHVSSQEDMSDHVEYQMDDTWIFANVDPIYIRLTMDSELSDDAAPPAFINAVTHKLAELISIAITGDVRLKQSNMMGAELMLEEGGSIDGQQGTPKRARASRLLRSRNRAGGGAGYGTGNYV